jgi:hypothetical protein
LTIYPYNGTDVGKENKMGGDEGLEGNNKSIITAELLLEDREKMIVAVKEPEKT